MKRNLEIFNKVIVMFLIVCSITYAQKPYRTGTTIANFLEVGYGSIGNSLGDAYVSRANDASSIYWNPAGLAKMEKSEVEFAFQPWYADINTSFASTGIVIPGIGTVGASLIYMDFGEMDVTTLDMQNGTGEKFSASDMAFSIAYGRKLADWFSFGVSAKYISSNIWHSTATAFAVDMGVLIDTKFFSPTGENEQGMKIGMSISNYGTEMRYDGLDLLNTIDPTPGEKGDYKDVPGQFKLQSWELPLIFRLGFTLTPIYTSEHRVFLSVDALHPNNNSESVNVGLEYKYVLPTFGELSFRGGYKGIFMNESDYGFSAGIGVLTYLLHNQGIQIDYAYRQHKTLGGTHSYGVSLFF